MSPGDLKASGTAKEAIIYQLLTEIAGQAIE